MHAIIKFLVIGGVLIDLIFSYSGGISKEGGIPVRVLKTEVASSTSSGFSMITV